jgi:hypothetical protein
MIHKVIHNIIRRYHPEKFGYAFFDKFVNNTLSKVILPPRTYVYIRKRTFGGDKDYHYARVEYYRSYIKFHINSASFRPADKRFVIVYYSDPQFLDVVKHMIYDSDNTQAMSTFDKTPDHQ